MGCSCAEQCPPCPQSIFIDTLDPECPVAVPGTNTFTNILTRVVPIPAGLPSFGVAIVADLSITHDEETDADVLIRIVDVGPDGTTTVLRVKTFEIAGGGDAGEDFAIIGGLNNLSAGNHTIILQVSSAVPVDVTEAGMRTDLVRMVTFDVEEECVG